MAVLYSWEGNHRSVVTLAVRHRLCGVSTYNHSDLLQQNEPPAYAAVWGMTCFNFLTMVGTGARSEGETASLRAAV